MKQHRALYTRLQSIIGLALILLLLSLWFPQYRAAFFTTGNGLTVLRQIADNLCLSLGMTLVILTAGIDLSVGSVLAFSGMIAAWLIKSGLNLPWLGVHLQFTMSGAILGALLVGAAMGAVNGIVITRLKVPPFIATLGMLSAGRSLTNLWANGFPITSLGAGFTQLGNGHFLGVSIPVWIAGVLSAVFILVTRRTRFGRHVYAVGGNERAALLSGLPVARITFLVYVIAGLLSAVAGIISIARLDTADPNAGVGYELDSIAAVVIGGTSLSGGRGSILGTILGCLMIGILNNSLTILGVSPYFQGLVKGMVIVIAVALDRRNAETA
jgi:ribose transport system permease protein